MTYPLKARLKSISLLIEIFLWKTQSIKTFVGCGLPWKYLLIGLSVRTSIFVQLLFLYTESFGYEIWTTDRSDRYQSHFAFLIGLFFYFLLLDRQNEYIHLLDFQWKRQLKERTARNRKIINFPNLWLVSCIHLPGFHLFELAFLAFLLQDDQAKARNTKIVNKILLQNILPQHVADVYLTK